jgi:hypothetical protein
MLNIIFTIVHNIVKKYVFGHVGPESKTTMDATTKCKFKLGRLAQLMLKLSPRCCCVGLMFAFSPSFLLPHVVFIEVCAIKSLRAMTIG